MKHTLGLWAISAACALVACGDDDGGSDAGTDASDANIDAVIDTGPSGPAESLFELDGPIDTSETFFDLPCPSDLRLNPDGTPSDRLGPAGAAAPPAAEPGQLWTPDSASGGAGGGSKLWTPD